MGGNIFTTPGPDGQPALKVPRMSPEQYTQVRDRCVELLQTVYHYVKVPHDAPGKSSFGDVDIHVSKPKRDIGKQEIGQLLGAERMDLTGTITNSYALILPDTDPSAAVEDREFCQVDVHHTAEGYEDWEMMFQSYGDLMQIVGKFLRYAGFTATDKGLHVRISEIECAGRRTESMLYLTHDAAGFMDFLGLDYERWKQGFTTQEQIFEWSCTGRFFSAKAFEGDVENHNDRQRYRKRSMFKDFADSWLPRHADLCKGPSDRQKLRQTALAEAIAYFDKQAEYDTKIQAFEQEEAEKAFWERVNDVVPKTGDDLRQARRALRRWVVFEAGRPRIRQEAEMDTSKHANWVEEVAAAGDDGAKLLEWIGSLWDLVYNLEREREAKAKRERDANKNIKLG